jgi:alkanesulfonate monooxygenase SsuD/methylene tetrahydromethanopterin reductase-like flavin-dependent oxidoreductase (luciferase family)
VAIGVLPTPMRNTAITAMEVSALARVHPDRLRVGFGHGVQSWMRQIGAKAESPLTLLQEQFGAVERLLRGESVTVSGRYVNLTDVELAWPPEKVPQLLVGATGPKTLALSGELAQGTVLSGGTTPDGVRRAIAHIGTQDHEVVVYVICAFGSGGRERALAEALGSGCESPEEAIAVGTAADVAAAAQRWTDAGATTVVLQPTVYEPDVREFIRLVAQEVQPLLA